MTHHPCIKERSELGNSDPREGLNSVQLGSLWALDAIECVGPSEARAPGVGPVSPALIPAGIRLCSDAMEVCQKLPFRPKTLDSVGKCSGILTV